MLGRPSDDVNPAGANKTGMAQRAMPVEGL